MLHCCSDCKIVVDDHSLAYSLVMDYSDFVQSVACRTGLQHKALQKRPQERPSRQWMKPVEPGEIAGERTNEIAHLLGGDVLDFNHF